MIRCAMFDFDGVIAESVNVKTEAFYQIYLPFGLDIAEKVRDHHLEHGGISRVEKFKYYESKLLGKDYTHESIEGLCKTFSELVFEKVVSSPLVPGIIEFLNLLDGSGTECFVISGTPQEELEKIVFKRELSKFFRGIYGSPTLKHTWIEKILKDTSLTPNECIFLGDANTDYKAAKQTNVPFVLRQTNETPLELVEKSKFVVQNFTDLDFFKKSFLSS